MRSVRHEVVLGAALVGWAALVVAVAFRAPAIVATIAQTGRLTVYGWSVSRGVVYLTPWVTGALLGDLAAVVVARARGVPLRAFAAAGVVFVAGLVLGARLQYVLELPDGAAALWRDPSSVFGPGGMRLPLGLLVGSGAALVWCRVRGTPWLAVGDALATAVALMSAVGRLGCVLVGCCMGRVCEANGLGLCLRYPSPAPVFLNQVAAHALEASSALSHPAHVLSVYFALVGTAELAVLLLLLRARAPVGSLLLAFALVDPTLKMVLESLRAVPRAGSQMVVIPLLTLVIALAVAARRRTGSAVAG